VSALRPEMLAKVFSLRAFGEYAVALLLLLLARRSGTIQRFIWSVYNLVSQAPVAIIAFLRLFVAPSCLAAIHLVLALFASYFIRTAALALHSTQMLGSLKKFLQEFPDCRFREFDITDLLPPPYVQSLKSAAPPAPSIRNRFFQIERQRGGRLPSELVAFPYQPGRTYAFFRDTGDKLEGAAKFFFFHEIGHSLYKAVSPYEGRYVGRMLLIFFPIWHILTHDWSSTPWTTYYAFGYMIFCYIFLGNQHSRSIFSVEVQADAFACWFLDSGDFPHLRQHIDTYGFPDGNLPEIWNSLRRVELDKNIQLRLEGKYPHPFYINWKFSLARQLFFLIACVFLALQPETTILWRLLVSVSVCIVLHAAFLIIQMSGTLLLRSEIDRELIRRTLSMTEAAEVNLRNHPAVTLSSELSQNLRSLLDRRRKTG
jgi:hypothetical protein